MPLNLNLNRTVRRLATATLRRIPSGPDRLMPALFDAQQITPELVLSAFRLGVIPLENGPGRIKWELPERRALMSIEQFHVPKNVARLVRNQRFEVTANEAFEETVAACAEIRGQRNSTTWIVPRLQRAFAQLHAMGAAHSIECRKDGELAGGLFGLAFGSYFITLSQFHRVRDASKVALVQLTRVLQAGGFTIHDVVYPSPHLAQFGCSEVSRQELLRLLTACSVRPVSFDQGFDIVQSQRSQQAARAS